MTYCGLLDLIFFVKTTQIVSDFLSVFNVLKSASLQFIVNVQ